MSTHDYYIEGKTAYDAGERWISACPYAPGWRKDAWQSGFWARRSEVLSVGAQ